MTQQEAQRRYDRLVRQISRLSDREMTDRRAARLERLVARREKLKSVVDTFEAPVETPKDEVSYEFYKTDLITGVKVTITDSPFDDTFVGGEASEIVFKGTQTRGCNTKGWKYTTGLTPDTFANTTETFISATNLLNDKLDGSYDVTVGLKQGDNFIFSEVLI